MKANIFIILAAIVFLFQDFVSGRTGGGRGGSRGGSSARGGGFRSSGGSNIRSGSRFSFSRTNGYRYGIYSGSRYGTAIRRTTYWPIYRIGFGYPYYYYYPYNNYYYYNQRPPINNITDVPNEIDISDTYKKAENISDVSYNCVNSNGIVMASCFEPIFESSNGSTNYAIDGCCCENTSSNLAICCLVELDSNLSKANSLM